MAAPAPENGLPRNFEMDRLYGLGQIPEPEYDAVIAFLNTELTNAGRTYDCPKCGGLGYHLASVDAPSIAPADDYNIRCTLGTVQPIYATDPTVQCLGWGKLTIALKYPVDMTQVIPV